MDEIVQIISTVGFPIATAIYLLWVAERQRKDNAEAMDKQRQENREDSAKWTDAINRNTTVIERLLDRFEQH